MNRRTMLHRMAATAGGLVLTQAMTGAPVRAQMSAVDLAGPQNPLAAPWAAWKAAFLAEDGRVIDTLQQGASHSESQGYGLYLAALFGDDAAFDAIFGWTEANLAIRPDALLAWRWLPEGAGEVPDLNNASDGDLFYAWGLVLRGQRDGNAAMQGRAGAIARDLVAACVRPAPDGSGRLVLTPAAWGFDNDDGLLINPSYYMPLAMRDVARATGTSDLAICAADGVAMMADLAQGSLIPDWVRIGPEGFSAPTDRPDHNGYEAMRVPLFLCWSGNRDHPAVAQQARAYQRAAPEMSGSTAGQDHVTVFDRATGQAVETSPHVGYGALAALLDCATTPDRGAPIPFYRTVDQPYYPATLHLMVLITQITIAPECVPI